VETLAARAHRHATARTARRHGVATTIVEQRQDLLASYGGIAALLYPSVSPV
jgi:hypothetical protein